MLKAILSASIADVVISVPWKAAAARFLLEDLIDINSGLGSFDTRETIGSAFVGTISTPATFDGFTLETATGSAVIASYAGACWSVCLSGPPTAFYGFDAGTKALSFQLAPLNASGDGPLIYRTTVTAVGGSGTSSFAFDTIALAVGNSLNERVALTIGDALDLTSISLTTTAFDVPSSGSWTLAPQLDEVRTSTDLSAVPPSAVPLPPALPAMAQAVLALGGFGLRHAV